MRHLSLNDGVLVEEYKKILERISKEIDRLEDEWRAYVLTASAIQTYLETNNEKN